MKKMIGIMLVSLMVAFAFIDNASAGITITPRHEASLTIQQREPMGNGRNFYNHPVTRGVIQFNDLRGYYAGTIFVIGIDSRESVGYTDLEYYIGKTGRYKDLTLNTMFIYANLNYDEFQAIQEVSKSLNDKLTASARYELHLSVSDRDYVSQGSRGLIGLSSSQDTKIGKLVSSVQIGDDTGTCFSKKGAFIITRNDLVVNKNSTIFIETTRQITNVSDRPTFSINSGVKFSF